MTGFQYNQQTPAPVYTPNIYQPQIPTYQQPAPQYMSQTDRLAQLQQFEAQLREQNNPQQSNRLINVGNIEEAKGFLSPADGSKVYFINSANGEIYCKHLDFATGKSNFYTYKLQENKQENDIVGAVNTVGNLQDIQDLSDYIKKEDFNALKKEYTKLKEDLTKIKKKLNSRVEEKVEEKSEEEDEKE